MCYICEQLQRKYTNKMTIPNKTIKNWKSLMDHGDISKIASEAKVDYRSVSRAFKSKKCSVDLYSSLVRFFDAREAKILKIENDHN